LIFVIWHFPPKACLAPRRACLVAKVDGSAFGWCSNEIATVASLLRNDVREKDLMTLFVWFFLLKKQIKYKFYLLIFS